MKKIISLVAVAGLTIFLAGCSYQATVDEKNTEQSAAQQNTNQPTPAVDNNQNIEQPIAQVDEYQGWSSFSNPTGGYSFKYSPTWSAAINQYNNKNSLFGVGATSQSGKGGVEVSSYTGTLEAYLNYMEQNAEVKYLARENVTINGVSGIRTNHEGFPVSGYSVLLKKGDQVFNIFINSKETNDIKLFDKLVASFAFSN